MEIQFQIGKKYRIFIPADHKKREDRLFVGKVIYKTDRYTVFEGVNYRESFLNWDLERLMVKEVS